MSIRLIGGDCREVLATLPADSVHCVVTSPPYYGLRDYGVDRQIGLEATPDAYLAEMVAVFREVKRVLRPDGTCWVNMGDSYASAPVGSFNGGGFKDKSAQTGGRDMSGVATSGVMDKVKASGLKPKDLLMMPARLALALQADGWWLRSDIIWHKPNPMPESVTDRPTSAHEHVFLLTRSPRYFYDASAIAEPSETSSLLRLGQDVEQQAGSLRANGGAKTNGAMKAVGGSTRACRNVWTIATAPYSEAHFATFPPALAERCVRAGTSERGCCAACGAPWGRRTERTAMVLDRSERTHPMGRTRTSGTMIEPPTSTTTGWSPSCACNADTVPCTVLDPFAGAGTTLLVADRLQRDAIGIELNPDYTRMAMDRCRDDAPLFASPPPAEPLVDEPRIRDLFAEPVK